MVGRNAGPREYAVIGLGRFGSSLALRLIELGHSVLGIDRDRELVQRLADDLTQTAVLDETLFEVVSALSTCGYSLGLTARLNAVGQLIVAVLMFGGRLGPLTLMIAFAQRRRRRQRVAYPGARLLLG
jgi:UDP-N-acetyl-D-mannosaminuronate dehydrogenase